MCEPDEGKFTRSGRENGSVYTSERVVKKNSIHHRLATSHHFAPQLAGPGSSRARLNPSSLIAAADLRVTGLGSHGMILPPGTSAIIFIELSLSGSSHVAQSRDRWNVPSMDPPRSNRQPPRADDVEPSGHWRGGEGCGGSGDRPRQTTSSSYNPPPLRGKERCGAGASQGKLATGGGDSIQQLSLRGTKNRSC